ncbi:MAG TPA: DUF3180 domain-containing protein [Pseudonocardiaceae bacterium]
MRFTRARDLLIIGALTAVLVNVYVTFAYDTVPMLPHLAGLTLLVLAAIELWLSFTMRSRTHHKPGTRPVEPMNPVTAVRIVALAKASSVLGALMAGAWLAVLVYTLPRRGQSIAAANDSTSSVIGLVSALALIAAALWLEYNCRAPKDDEDERKHSDQSNPR